MTMTEGRKKRWQTPRSSACRADTRGITGRSSGGGSGSVGSQSVHRHTKVLMTGLQERNVHCLDKKAAGVPEGSAHTDIHRTCR